MWPVAENCTVMSAYMGVTALQKTNSQHVTVCNSVMFLFQSFSKKKNWNFKIRRD